MCVSQRERERAERAEETGTGAQTQTMHNTQHTERQKDKRQRDTEIEKKKDNKAAEKERREENRLVPFATERASSVIASAQTLTRDGWVLAYLLLSCDFEQSRRAAEAVRRWSGVQEKKKKKTSEENENDAQVTLATVQRNGVSDSPIEWLQQYR